LLADKTGTDCIFVLTGGNKSQLSAPSAFKNLPPRGALAALLLASGHVIRLVQNTIILGIKVVNEHPRALL
jgi:hypothetical protein